MRFALRTLIVGVATLSAALTAIPAEATATLWSIEDASGDSKFGIDIKRTTLDTQRAGYYRVRTYGYEFTRERLNTATVYFDTKSADAGPEYMISWGLPNDGVFSKWDGDDYKARLVRMDSWRSQIKLVACRGIKLRVDLSSDVVTFLVPRRCLGNPAEVRWNVETERITSVDSNGAYRYFFDAAPGRRVFPASWVG